MAKGSEDWVHERTFGGSKGHFWWRLDDAGTVSILLVYGSTAGRKQQIARAFRREELGQILDFMADGEWHPCMARTTSLKAKTLRLPDLLQYAQNANFPEPKFL